MLMITTPPFSEQQRFLKVTASIAGRRTVKRVLHVADRNTDSANVLTHLIVLIISQLTHMSNYHVIYLKFTQCYLSILSL